MGDAMMALNCAHRWSEENNKLQLNLHWYHDKDHLHHPEETETIIERTDYINGLYLKSNVKINHIINSDQTQLKLVKKDLIGLNQENIKPITGHLIHLYHYLPMKRKL
jgi:predicted RecB family nuclease